MEPTSQPQIQNEKPKRVSTNETGYTKNVNNFFDFDIFGAAGPENHQIKVKNGLRRFRAEKQHLELELLSISYKYGA